MAEEQNKEGAVCPVDEVLAAALSIMVIVCCKNDQILIRSTEQEVNMPKGPSKRWDITGICSHNGIQVSQRPGQSSKIEESSSLVLGTR